jgi:hypothetical protein
MRIEAPSPSPFEKKKNIAIPLPLNALNFGAFRWNRGHAVALGANGGPDAVCLLRQGHCPAWGLAQFVGQVLLQRVLRRRGDD